MFFKLKEFLRLFICFTRKYGLRRAFLRVVVWVIIGLSAPRHEMRIKLRNGYELFLIPKDVGISAELRIFRIHEPLATQVLTKKLKKGMVVVDIGSNIGYYAVLESRLVGKNGTVVAVEPDPVNFSYLLKNIRLNKLTNLITVNKAISKINGTVEMIKSNRSNWSRIVQNKQNLAPHDMIGIIPVEAVTLDTLIKQLKLKKVDLIRMDVEGHEDHIIMASQYAIQKYLPDIFMEIHQFLIGKNRLVSLLNRLNDIGYNIRCIIPRNVDFALVYRNDDVTVKNIAELISGFAPDVLSVYFTAHQNQK